MEKKEMSQREYESRISEYNQAYTKKRLELDGRIASLKSRKNTLIKACDNFREDIRAYNEQIRELEADRSEAKLLFQNKCSSLRNKVNIVTCANTSLDCFSSTQLHYLTYCIAAAVKRALKDFDNVALDDIWCEYYANEEGRIAFNVTVPKK